VKTTLMSRRKTANPRRTTLAHLKDASELGVVPVERAAEAEAPRPLPATTANPRRTVLTELPTRPTA
jgi:hypothetical protein